jgi:predicted transcriptional regulator
MMKDKVIDLVNQGKTQKEIAKIIGTATHNITAICKELNIGSRRSENRTDEQIQAIRSKYSENGSKIATAKHFGISRMTVHKYVKDMTPKRDTCEDLVRSLNNSGMTRKQIEKATGLTSRTVRKYTDKDIKQPKIKMTKKKEVKAVQPMVERYELIGKGISKGVKEVKTTLREGRNDGVTVSFRYNDEYSSKSATIYVKDGVSTANAAKRWCERNGKTLIGVL